ncbi:MAG: SUMF1/EgtB/PvdO family nonheme iron enzyme [Simkania sp.]|nr:SUMF1/EgtB/PvdO family nonheme iron enzyme [Simkania sp.]
MSFEFPELPPSIFAHPNMGFFVPARPFDQRQALAMDILRFMHNLDHPNLNDLRPRIAPINLYVDVPRTPRPIAADDPLHAVATENLPHHQEGGEIATHDTTNTNLQPQIKPLNGKARDIASGHDKVPAEGAVTWNQQMLAFFIGRLQILLKQGLDISEQEAPNQGVSNQITQLKLTSQQQKVVEALEQGLAQVILENMKPKSTGERGVDGLLSRCSIQNGQVPTALEQRFMQMLQEILSKRTTIPSSKESYPTDSTQKVLPNETVPKQFTTTLALKLLSINHLREMFVEQSAKKENSLETTRSAFFSVIVEIGKMVAYLDQLTALLQESSSANSTKLYSVIMERLKEVETIVGELLTQPTTTNMPLGEKPKILERLVQETEWLTTLLSSVKKSAEEQKGIKESLQSSKGFKELQAFVERNPSKNLNATMQANQTGAFHYEMVRPTYRNEVAQLLLTLENGKTMPLAMQVPKNAAEFMGMVHVHLNKIIPQPLPLIIPYPISMPFHDVIDGIQSSGHKKTKDEQQKEKEGFGGGQGLGQSMVLIPGGPVIVGDPFEEGREDERPTRIEQLDPFIIATTPITNSQFASWVSSELLQKRIQIENPGKIYDSNKRLLAMTVEGVITSQLELSSDDGVLEVRPVRGKHDHPVVHVTYFGAKAFCEANGFRLPTQMEWERAAGMMPTEYGQPLKKLRYASGSEQLTAALAIYRESATLKSPFNLTLPVGFFNGQRVYTKDGQRVETALSVSPWGCSDMSGNVREWIEDDYDKDGLFKITKGGSYGDSLFDLRVAAKIPLPPGLSDAYTGFRVVV